VASVLQEPGGSTSAGELPARRPLQPPRQRWFVWPNTWQRELVIDRAREWARQTGAPPRYHDWGPVDRARAAALDSSLAHKWEREHPHWPSAGVVYRHLGSWRELLAAAGFPAPAPLELPLDERVREALRLRGDGLRWAQVGELLGISPDTARRYAHAHDCERCGTAVINPRAARCARCARGATINPSRWGAPFSERELITAIRDWAALEGRAPAQIDWRPDDRGGHPRWEREMPTLATDQRRRAALRLLERGPTRRWV
jgi:ribosomal protein L37E